MFRRETMIALRARRKAFEVATKIAHPPVQAPPLPPPDAAAPDPHAHLRRRDADDDSTDDTDVSWLILLGLVLAFVLFVILYV